LYLPPTTPPRPPTPPLFPYTTLFRSNRHPTKLLKDAWKLSIGIKGMPGRGGLGRGHKLEAYKNGDPEGKLLREWIGDKAAETYRSEEHTSELQSLRHLVCRLLLEKKK